MSPKPKRILVVRTDRLGDVILTLPTFRFLKACFPDARIAALLSRYTGQIVEGNAFVDEFLWYDDGGNPRPFAEMLRLIKAGRFDAVVLVHPTLRLAWLLFRAGIPLRIGTGYRYYSFLFNSRIFEHRKDARRHEVEYNLNLLSGLDCRPPARPRLEDFAIAVPQEAATTVERLLAFRGVQASQRRVVLHPGSGGSAREWPAENLERLASLILQDAGVTILVTGSADEKPSVEEFVRHVGGCALGIAGELTLKELAALISSASLFVGHSSGPLHIAVAVGTPVLGFYPQLVPMSAQRWCPYVGRNIVLVPDKPADCRECAGQKGGSCACMESIPVARAYESALALLAGSPVRAEGAPYHGI